MKKKYIFEKKADDPAESTPVKLKKKEFLALIETYKAQNPLKAKQKETELEKKLAKINE